MTDPIYIETGDIITFYTSPGRSRTRTDTVHFVTGNSIFLKKTRLLIPMDQVKTITKDASSYEHMLVEVLRSL